MAIFIDIIMAIAFVISSGLLFNEKFRGNLILVAVASTLAITSTFFLIGDLLSIKIEIDQDANEKISRNLQFIADKSIEIKNNYSGYFFAIIAAYSLFALIDTLKDSNNYWKFYFQYQKFAILFFLLTFLIGIGGAVYQIQYNSKKQSEDNILYPETQPDLDMNAADAMEGTTNDSMTAGNINSSNGIRIIPSIGLRTPRPQQCTDSHVDAAADGLPLCNEPLPSAVDQAADKIEKSRGSLSLPR